MKKLVLALLLSMASWCAAEVCVVVYHKGASPRKVATVYRGVEFAKIKEQWPAGGARHIEYWAVPDSACPDSTLRPWAITWPVEKITAVGDSLSPDSTYTGRF